MGYLGGKVRSCKQRNRSERVGTSRVNENFIETKNSARVGVYVISPRVIQFTEAGMVYCGNIQAQSQDFMKCGVIKVRV